MWQGLDRVKGDSISAVHTDFLIQSFMWVPRDLGKQSCHLPLAWRGPSSTSPSSPSSTDIMS